MNGWPLLAVWSAALLACSQEPQPAPAPAPAAVPVAPPVACIVAGYDLGVPLRSFALPADLREISAIAAVDADTIACLQDEKGELFLLDPKDGAVRARAVFGPDGDYEGLARQGDAFWVLRSDGRILRVVRSDGGLAIGRVLAVQAPQTEFEGLALDAATGSLIVAPKSIAKAVGDKELRPLYAVDPVIGTTAAVPYATIDRDAVLQAAERLAVAVPTVARRGKEKVLFRLRFSEVAVQPDSGRLWLLSAVDRAVVVADRDGAIHGVHFFAPEQQPQPEGAAFLSNGELLIASEGGDGVGVVRVYGKAK